MTANRRMLDTNTVSHLIRQHPAVTRRVVETPMAILCVSVITEAELLFGLARRPKATKLHQVVRELLRRIDVLTWDRSTAEIYGPLRAGLAAVGRTMGPLDLLIAAHAIATGSILVSNDQAFRMIAGLAVEDWTIPSPATQSEKP